MKANRRELETMENIMAEIKQAMLVVIQKKSEDRYYNPTERKYTKTSIKRKILMLREMLLELQKDIDESIYY